MTSFIDPVEHLSLAYSVANRFLRRHRSCFRLKEDIEAAAILGLCEAAAHFRPEKGEWAHYAPIYIHWRMVHELRAISHVFVLPRRGERPNSVSFEALTAPGPSETLTERNSRVIDEIRTSDGSELVARTIDATTLLETLSPRSKQILRRRFGLEDDNDETLQEIGNDLSLTRERIRQIEEEALNSLRKYAYKEANPDTIPFFG